MKYGTVNSKDLGDNWSASHHLSQHDITWTDRRSFNYRLSCSCGWESHLHLMERDAMAEGRRHLEQG